MLRIKRKSCSPLILAPVAALVCLSVNGLAEDETKASATNEALLLNNIRQLTFDGKRAGEGYFSRDGKRMVFQSERDADNPFYQIYLMDLEFGDVNRISPGYGKTTCSWIHPTESRVLFASTHDDPDARAKQQAEIDFRASGQERRYAWDYDEHFELYSADFDGGNIKRLTNARGYDAEGSYSPDGQWIAFASNRASYTEDLSQHDAEMFKVDPAYMMDIYIMRADGSDVRQLTNVKGYDGGPFFSPDGKRITWRRFAENGLTAEIYTMNIDGSDQKRITHLNAMSWAPYYHPSGDYLIFATNRHGFENFELYMVDTEGAQTPVRVTGTAGFDGLPVFAPDGNSLAWTSNRTADGSSQIYLAKWNDAEARTLLYGSSANKPVTLDNAPDFNDTAADIRASDIRQHIEFLASEQMQGRRSGTAGEQRATQYIASVLESIGLQPGGDANSYFQSFAFTAGVSLGDTNELRLTQDKKTLQFQADQQWRPLAFSQTGSIAPSDIVFAGYGIKASANGDIPEYDSYTHLDVTGKWVMVLRYMPEDISPELRQHFSTHSSLRYKAMTARDLGAAGLIVVSGPNAQVREQLVPMVFDTALGSTSVAAISITDAAAQQILSAAERDLQQLQTSLDDGSVAVGFAIPDVKLGGNIEIKTETQRGRNVIAVLPAKQSTAPAVVIGAHADHLGTGRSGSSLARDDEQSGIHYGADDNASGVAAVLEIAQYLKNLADNNRLPAKRDIIFALWSGEELGLLGSEHFVDVLADKETLNQHVSSYLNMDMIGRLTDKVQIQGVGSSDDWAAQVERRNVPIGLPIALQQDPYLPTDVRSFYLRGIPVLNAFTGSHEDYHTPRDTADKINYDGVQHIAQFMALLARGLAADSQSPRYAEYAQPENLTMRANMRAYLGTIPDYIESEIKGVPLSGVSKGAPAATAGLLQGDIIVELAGRKIENIYDYTYAIEALKIGETVKVVVVRDGNRVEADIKPTSRQ